MIIPNILTSQAGLLFQTTPTTQTGTPATVIKTAMPMTNGSTQKGRRTKKETMKMKVIGIPRLTQKFKYSKVVQGWQLKQLVSLVKVYFEYRLNMCRRINQFYKQNILFESQSFHWNRVLLSSLASLNLGVCNADFAMVPLLNYKKLITNKTN